MTDRPEKQIIYSHTEEKNIKFIHDIIEKENLSSFRMKNKKYSHNKCNFKVNNKFTIAKRRGKLEQGEKIYWGLISSIFGNMIMTATSEGLCGLAFCKNSSSHDTLHKLSKPWKSELVEDRVFITDIAKRVFLVSQGVQLHLLGTDMQMQIWQKLLEIPYATIKSYSYLAEKIGRPNAVRAVANAVGANPIAWVIPCHRVLSKRNKLSGYRWGQNLKVDLLSHEMGLSSERLFNLQYSCLR